MFPGHIQTGHYVRAFEHTPAEYYATGDYIEKESFDPRLYPSVLVKEISNIYSNIRLDRNQPNRKMELKSLKRIIPYTLQNLNRMVQHGDPLNNVISFLRACQQRHGYPVLRVFLADAYLPPQHLDSLAERLEHEFTLTPDNSLCKLYPELGMSELKYFGRNPEEYGLTPSHYRLERLLVPATDFLGIDQQDVLDFSRIMPS